MACTVGCVITALGVVCALRLLYAAALFALKLVAPPADLSKYRSGDDTWAVVTGGAGGIGEAFARRLAAARFNIVLLDRNRERLVELREAIAKEYGVKVLAEEANFSPADAALWDKLDALLRLLDVGVLVNNVGVTSEVPGALEHIPVDEVSRIIDVNVTATTMMTRLLIPRLRLRRRSLIITLTSFVSLVPVPMLQVYSASKRYTEHLMAAVAAEYRGKVDVTCVAPWWVATAMTKIRRTSFRVISADAVARGALRHAGRFFMVDPYWLFAVLDIVVSAVPSCLVNYGANNFLGMVRRTYLKRAARIAAEKDAAAKGSAN